jgi:hypothetical protein
VWRLLAFQTEKEETIALYPKYGRHRLPPSWLSEEAIMQHMVDSQLPRRRRIPGSIREIIRQALDT